MNYYDPNEMNVCRTMASENFNLVLRKIASDLISQFNASKKRMGTIDETLMNFIEQDGRIAGVEMFLETINSIANDTNA